MPASAHKNLDSGCPSRSTRFKNIHVVYEDSDRDPSSFKRIKTEAAKEKDTTSDRDKILSSAQTFLLKATMQDRGLEKPGRRIAELEQSKVVIGE
jgi:hypothetical protein